VKIKIENWRSDLEKITFIKSNLNLFLALNQIAHNRAFFFDVFRLFSPPLSLSFSPWDNIKNCNFHMHEGVRSISFKLSRWTEAWTILYALQHNTVRWNWIEVIFLPSTHPCYSCDNVCHVRCCAVHKWYEQQTVCEHCDIQLKPLNVITLGQA
jgi:hypothetical protein